MLRPSGGIDSDSVLVIDLEEGEAPKAMSKAPGVKQVSAVPPLTNVQDLLDWVAGDPSLDEQQRKNEMCAIRALAKAAQLPLSAIPLDPVYLSNEIFALTPARAGFAPDRWKQVRSIGGRVPKRAGIWVVAVRRRNALSLAWQIPLKRIPDKHRGYRLSTFARFCSARNIEPTDVTADTFAAFLEEETSKTGKGPRARITYRATCRTWNWAAESFDWWPKVTVEVPNHSNRFSLPRDAFAATLWEDFNAYATASMSETADIFDEGAPKVLRRKTIKERRQLVWEMASAQIHQGRQIETIAGLKELVEPEWVANGLRYLHARYRKKTRRLLDFASAMKSIARNWAKPGDAAIKQLGKLCTAVDPREAGFAKKNMDTIAEFGTPEKALELLLLAHTIYRELCGHKKLTVEDARLMMAAVAVELLLRTMIRLENLTEIDLEKNFWRPNNGKHGIRHLYFEHYDVKNDEPLRFALGPKTIEMIDFFVGKCRPLLISGPTTKLFPIEGDVDKREAHLRYLVTATVKRRVGVHVTPHQFRHIGCKLYLDIKPGDFETLRVMLGHTTIKTTMAHYAQLKATKALEMFTAAVFADCDAAIAKWKT
jgi:integrase